MIKKLPSELEDLADITNNISKELIKRLPKDLLFVLLIRGKTTALSFSPEFAKLDKPLEGIASVLMKEAIRILDDDGVWINKPK